MNFHKHSAILLLALLGVASGANVYDNFKNVVSSFHDTAKGLSTHIKCKCQVSLNTQARMLTSLATSLESAFKANPSAPTPNGVRSAIHNVRNSANHLAEETVWQSTEVKQALRNIRSEMDWLMPVVTSGTRTKDNAAFAQHIQQSVGRMTGYVKALNSGSKKYAV